MRRRHMPQRRAGCRDGSTRKVSTPKMQFATIALKCPTKFSQLGRFRVRTVLGCVPEFDHSWRKADGPNQSYAKAWL
jgi:hypothetical protein